MRRDFNTIELTYKNRGTFCSWTWQVLMLSLGNFSTKLMWKWGKFFPAASF